MTYAKCSIALIVAASVSGCATTARAPSSAGLGGQDLEFLTSSYQLIHFDLQSCSIVKRTTPPAYAAPIIAKVCSDAARHQGVLSALAAQTDAALPDSLSYNNTSDLVALNYNLSYHAMGDYTSQYPGPILPKPYYGGDFPSVTVAFLSYEIASHEQALTDFENEAQNGRNKEIKALAIRLIPLVRTNLAGLKVALAASPSK